MGKHQALFVHPPARILASTPTRLAADGPRKATRLSTEHMGGGRGVGFACSLWGKPPRSASCATDGGGGGSRKARSTAARSRPCKMAVTLSFSPTVSCSPTPMRVNICRELAGRVVCIKQTSPHTSYLAPTPTSSISTSETLRRLLHPHPAQLSCT